MTDEPIDCSPQAFQKLLDESQTLVDQMKAEHDRRVSELLQANTILVLQRRDAEKKLTEARDEVREYSDLFNKQHERTTKADRLWRAAHPGKELTLPDLGDLIDWLIKRGDYVNDVLHANDGLSAALRKERARNVVYDSGSLRDFQTALLVDCRPISSNC